MNKIFIRKKLFNKLSLILLLSLSVNFICKAQNTFYKIYDHNTFRVPGSIIKIQDNYLISGQVNPLITAGFLMKIDKKGNPIWEKRYNSYIIRSLMHTRDSNILYILTPQIVKSKIVKANENGDVIWETEMKLNYDYTKVIESNDSSYIYFGTKYTSGNEDMVVGKIDYSGKQIWETIYGTSDNERGKGIGVFSDNSIIALLCNNSKRNALYFTKFSKDGDPLWKKPLNDMDYSSDLMVTSKDNILFSTYQEYVCYDSTGTLKWKNNFPTSYYGDLNDFTTINDSTFILVGGNDPTYSFTNNDEQIKLLFINSNGTPLSEKTFGDCDANITGLSIVKADDGGFMILGNYMPTDKVFQTKILTIKVDSTGNIDNYFITGKIFLDVNENGFNDLNEPGIPGVLIKTSDNKYNCISDSSGYYKLKILEKDTFQIVVVAPENLKQTFPSSQNIYKIQFNQYFQTLTNYNFGFSNATNNFDLKSFLTGSGPIPNGETEYKVTVKNIGLKTIHNPVISLYFDSKILFQSSEIQPNIVQNNCLKWTLDSLNSLNSFTSKIKLTLANGSLTGPVSFKLVAEPIETDNFPDNNTCSLKQEIENTHPTNQKSVYPVIIENKDFIDNKIDTLRFHINFQNVNSDTAKNVFIVDTLSSFLNINKFEINGSSHNYTYNIENNVVSFIFNNIKLAGKGSSQNNLGFIDYSIPLLKDYNINDTVRNTAYICFDYYPFIKSNTTKSYAIISNIISLVRYNVDFEVNPNPNNGLMKIIFKDEIPKSDIHLKILDISGKIIYNKSLKLHNNQIELNLIGYPSGLYFLNIDIGKKVYSKKIILL